MSSPTRGAWVCRHGVDGRDICDQCYDDETDKLVGADYTRWEDPRDTMGGAE